LVSFSQQKAVLWVHVMSKVKVKFSLEQATKAQRGGVDAQLYSFFNLCARWG